MKPTWTGIFILVFIAYILNSVWTLYQLWMVPPCVEDMYCLKPSLKTIDSFKLHFYQSPTRNPKRNDDLHEIYTWNNFDYNIPQERSINVSLLKEAISNKTVYLHIVLVPQYVSANNPIAMFTNTFATTTTAALITHMIPEKKVYSILNSEKKENNQNIKSVQHPSAHWRTKMIFEIVTETSSLPSRNMPRELIKFIRLAPKNEYLPILFVNKMKYRFTDLQLINKTDSLKQLTVFYNPTSFGMLRLLVQLQAAMASMKNMGFSEKDVDEVKGIFTDTNFYLLCATFIIAAFHLMFDFLAFKNDIAFWRRKKTMVGVSFHTVLWRCISQIIIFLHLWDEEASKLILIPAFAGSFIEVWKVFKASKTTIHWNSLLPTLTFGSTSEDEKKSKEFDAEIMKYLRYFFYPICLAGAVYSLVYVEHKSFISWCLQSLVNGVYAFGFLLMLPQLFLNYKLKSVAHLPWKVFMYKAFNTFIDDVFAFIITMPTAHRIACFRDDIVFLIYLYQRWLYPVDKTRENEYGENFTDEKKTQ